MATEKRLIDANELTDRLNYTTMVAYPNLFPGLLAAIEVVDDSPTVDAAEVVHGRWVHHYYDSGEPIDDKWYCSECHMCNDHRRTWYCPNCGAKMDGLEGS